MIDVKDNGEAQLSPAHETHDAAIVPAPPPTHNELATTFPHNIPRKIPIILGNDGYAYALFGGPGVNSHPVRITSKFFKNVLRLLARQEGITLSKSVMSEVIDYLQAYAETCSEEMNVWLRTAPTEDGNGITLDVGDDRHTHIQITPGNVNIITEGSDILFYRTPTMQALPIPAETGDIGLLNKYINLHQTGVVLLIAWICYTIAHAKVPSTSFVILVLQGDQGSGKTFLCKMIQSLIDPSVVSVQAFPNNQKDLVIAAQNAHVQFYDNMRSIKPGMADTLCTAATGGALISRQLYTDADQHVHRLHVALVFNGIHSFIDQPDLAQRVLPLHLLSIDEINRLSETELSREFQADLPLIFRGLLDLIADVLKELPSVEVTNPERMIDFVRWLAAMEKVHNAPPGAYQDQYSEALKESMLDSLLENPLAAAVMSFIAEQPKGQWSGAPADLYHELSFLVGRRSRFSTEWPQNPIALSKRLKSLKAGLMRQNIEISFGRGKERRITIINLEAY